MNEWLPQFKIEFLKVNPKGSLTKNNSRPFCRNNQFYHATFLLHSNAPNSDLIVHCSNSTQCSCQLVKRNHTHQLALCLTSLYRNYPFHSKPLCMFLQFNLSFYRIQMKKKGDQAGYYFCKAFGAIGWEPSMNSNDIWHSRSPLITLVLQKQVLFSLQYYSVQNVGQN